MKVTKEDLAKAVNSWEGNTLWEAQAYRQLKARATLLEKAEAFATDVRRLKEHVGDMSLNAERVIGHIQYK